MKKMKFMIALLAAMFTISAQAQVQKQALLVGYSQTDNVYEDENIKAELVRLSLKITNKTNKPLFVDRSSSFYYINDDAICLDEKEDDTSYKHSYYQPLAPKSDTWVSTLRNPIRGKYSATASKGKKNEYTDLDLNVMNYMETMRYELANNDKKSCTSIHLTGDESFMKVKVYIIYTTQKYSGDEKEREEHSFTISTWISDLILTKYFIQEQDKIKQKTNAVNVQGRLTAIMHVFANSPFEYDEDKSPIDIYETSFDKGSFVIYRLGASAAEKEGKEDQDGKGKPGKGGKGNDQELKSNFEERSKSRQVLIWEGETTNWVQALQDAYERYLIEDGEKPKKAKEIAKDKAKDFKKEQTLKK